MPGDRVLIHSAAGGVGQIAVQMAKLAGCEVFATAGSEEKLQLLRDSYDVPHCINYRKSDFVSEVRRICNAPKHGCLDLILDPVGGSQLKSGIDLLRAGGRIVSFGAASLSDRSSFSGFFNAIPHVLSMLIFNGIDLLKKSKAFVGLNMLEIARERPDVLRKDVLAGLDFIMQGKIKTVVSKQYDWRQVGRAHREMEERRTTGKIVFIIPQPIDENTDIDATPIQEPIEVTQAFDASAAASSSSSSAKAPQQPKASSSDETDIPAATPSSRSAPYDQQ